MSDGIIAPSFSAEALEILKAKKGGKYIVLQASHRIVVTQESRRNVTRNRRLTPRSSRRRTSAAPSSALRSASAAPPTR